MDWNREERLLRIMVISGSAAFLSLTLAATTQYPDYSFWHNYLSDLGKHPPSAPYFNIGIIITGLLSLIFFTILALKPSPPRLRIPLASSCIASIGLIGVGVYPSTQPLGHTISVLLFFGFLGFAILLFSIEYLREGKKHAAAFGIAVFISDMILITLNYTSLGPAIQKITVAMMLLFIIVFAHNMPRAITPSQHPEE